MSLKFRVHASDGECVATCKIPEHAAVVCGLCEGSTIRVGRTVVYTHGEADDVSSAADIVRERDSGGDWKGPWAKWTVEEEESLIDLYRSGESYVKIAESLGRTETSVTVRIHLLKKQGRIKKRDIRKDLRPWTSADDKALVDRLKRGDRLSQIADALGRTTESVSMRSQRLAKQGVLGTSDIPGRWRRWSDEEIQTMVRLREEGTSVKDIAAALGRSCGAVRTRLHILKNADDGT